MQFRYLFTKAISQNLHFPLSSRILPEPAPLNPPPNSNNFTGCRCTTLCIRCLGGGGEAWQCLVIKAIQRRPAYLNVSPHWWFSLKVKKNLSFKMNLTSIFTLLFPKNNAKVNILVKVYVLNRFLTFVTTSTWNCWRKQFLQVPFHLTSWSIWVLVYFGHVEHGSLPEFPVST